MIRRTVEEWVTIASVSKGVGHLFVEGGSDASLIAHLSGYPPNLDVRSAQHIDCDVSDGHSLWGGAKLKLLRLGEESKRRGNPNNLRCLVDSDFSSFVSYAEFLPTVLGTGYANLPCSVLTEARLNSFLLKGFGFSAPTELWQLFCTVLQRCFIARYLSARSPQPKPAPDIAGFVKYSSSTFQFDEVSYLRSYFQVNSNKVPGIQKDISDMSALSPSDIRYIANSNDMFSLIYGSLRKRQIIGGSYPLDGIKNAYFASMDDNLLDDTNFSQLRSWITMF